MAILVYQRVCTSELSQDEIFRLFWSVISDQISLDSHRNSHETIMKPCYMLYYNILWYKPWSYDPENPFWCYTPLPKKIESPSILCIVWDRRHGGLYGWRRKRANGVPFRWTQDRGSVCSAVRSICLAESSTPILILVIKWIVFLCFT